MSRERQEGQPKSTPLERLQEVYKRLHLIPDHSLRRGASFFDSRIFIISDVGSEKHPELIVMTPWLQFAVSKEGLEWIGPPELNLYLGTFKITLAANEAFKSVPKEDEKNPAVKENHQNVSNQLADWIERSVKGYIYSEPPFKLELPSKNEPKIAVINLLDTVATGNQEEDD